MTDFQDITVDFDPFSGGELLRVCPTTIPQKEVIASTQMGNEANTAFNEAVSITVNGALDLELLELSFQAIINRHDILRATFSRRGDEICLQESISLKIDYSDLRNLGVEQQETQLANLWKNISLSPMNLEEGPLLFVWAMQLDEQRYEVVIATHHIVVDGWSFGILLEELVAIYNADGKVTALNTASSFFDFAEENDSSQIANLDIDYWFSKFKTIPPSLDLPLDHARKPFRAFSAARLDYHFDAALVATLPKAAAKLRSSMVNYVMAGYIALLHRLTGNQDIVIGLPVAGQAVFNRPEQMGHMVQLLPIRVSIEETTSFEELVSAVKTAVLDANEHANFSFGKLIEGLDVDRTRVPLISTIFNIDQPTPELNFGGSSASVRSIPRSGENFEMFINCVPSPENLLVEATYSTALFDEASILSWLHALENILQEASIDPQALIVEMALTQKIPEVLDQLNNTHSDTQYPDLSSAFEASVVRNPTRVAVISGQESVTYQELKQLVDKLVHILLSNGVAEGDVIAICCGRTVKTIVATLAVQKLGACYLPLDPEFPEERLQFMLSDSDATAVIEDDDAPNAILSADIKHIPLATLDETIDDDYLRAPPLEIKPNRLAYMIYTSGSTGQPKGVQVPCKSVINFLESMSKTPGCHASDKLLAVTTLSFDISVLELFLPLVTGASVVLASREQVNDSQSLKALIDQHDISIMQATPSTWRLLLADGWESNRKLKVLCGGEPLLADLAEALIPRVSELWNMFGPTETTVWSTCKKIMLNDKEISIGSPIANTKIYILDAKQQLLPSSMPGELCIGGDGVTLGYRNREALTQKNFICHPKLGHLYRTGDRAKITSEGDIIHLGRMDDQVKLRGYRVELGDIESALSTAPGVEQVAVYLWDEDPKDLRIVACCVPKQGESIQGFQIRKHLRRILPAYMVPHNFITVDEINLTPNGKVDRRNLPRPERQANTLTNNEGLQTNEEKLLGKLWTELLLPESEITRGDNFFEMGGHSLLAMEAIRKIETHTGVRLTPRDFIGEKLSTLAVKIAKKEDNVSTSDRPVSLGARSPRMISPVQNRIIDRQLNNPQSTCFNLPAAWQLEGEIELNKFSESLHYVVERQAALRSTVDANKKPCLARPNIEQYYSFIDLSDVDDALSKAKSDIALLTRSPIDPINSMMFKSRLYKIKDSLFLFFVLPHQSIFDGWSFDILLTEIESTYRAKCNTQAPELNYLALEYRDCSTWASARKPRKDSIEYFRSTLDRPKAQLFSHTSSHQGQCARISDEYDVSILKKFEQVTEEKSYRTHELLFALYSLALQKVYAQNNFVIGVPVSGRYHPEVIGLIGSFVSTLPLALELNETNNSAQIKSIVEQLQTFLEHQDITLDDIIGDEVCNFSDNELATSFGFQDIRNRPQSFANLALKQTDIERTQTEFPLEFWVRIDSNRLLVVYDFDTEYLNAESVELIRKTFSTLLRDLTSGDLLNSRQSELKLDQIASTQEKSIWRKLFSRS